MDSDGKLIGIITKSIQNGAAFAVPIESVMGLSEGAQNIALGNGAALQINKPSQSPSSASLAGADPKKFCSQQKR